MKNASSSLFLTTTVIALSAILCQAEDLPTSQNSPRLAISTIGINDPLLVNDATNYVSINLSVPVRYAGHQPSPAESFEAAVKQVESMMTSNDFAVLGIINIPEKVSFQKAVVVSKNVALVNINSLSTDLDLKNQVQRGLYIRRIHKQLMNMSAQLIGLEPCIFPLCVMVPAATFEQLDAKGANLCPPCWGKCEKLLRDRNVQPLSDR